MNKKILIERYGSGFTETEYAILEQFRKDRENTLKLKKCRQELIDVTNACLDPRVNLTCTLEQCIKDVYARVANLEAENDRLRQDRYDALSVHSKDGLLSSEWIARTGAAERKCKNAEAQLATLRERLEGLVKEYGDGWEYCKTLHPNRAGGIMWALGKLQSLLTQTTPTVNSAEHSIPVTEQQHQTMERALRKTAPEQKP